MGSCVMRIDQTFHARAEALAGQAYRERTGRWVGFNTASDLHRLRKRAHLSRRQLAEATGLSPDAVKYWEQHAGRIDGHAPEAFRKHFERLGLQVPERGAPPVSIVDPKPRDIFCGARTRMGGKCQCKALPGRTRCKFHGGMSTGPKSAEGRQRIADAQRLRWARIRDIFHPLAAPAEHPRIVAPPPAAALVPSAASTEDFTLAKLAAANPRAIPPAFWAALIEKR